MWVSRTLLSLLCVTAVLCFAILVSGCHGLSVTQDEALNVLESYHDSLYALTGVTGTEVVADARGSYYIRLAFAFQKHIDQLGKQDQLPRSLDSVPVKAVVANPPQVSEVVQDNVVLGISTDKTIYESEENVILTAYAENRSSQPYKFEYGYIGEIIIAVIYPEGYPQSHKAMPIIEGGVKAPSGLAWVKSGILAPGEQITLETFWDQKFVEFPNDSPAIEHVAPPGVYTIFASLGEDPGGFPEVFVTVTIWSGS